MVISHYGLGMVKIQQGETVIIFNPIQEAKDAPAGVKPMSMGADVALVSWNDPAYNGVDKATRGERVPLIIDGPGEYETGGIFVKGFGTAGPAGQINTVYLVILEGVRLVHLGALVEPKLSEVVTEELGVVDVLFAPVGNGRLLNPKQASQIIAALEPELVVPVDYDERALAAFLKEMGTEPVAPVDSLALKKKDLVGGKTKVVVVKSF